MFIPNLKNTFRDNYTIVLKNKNYYILKIPYYYKIKHVKIYEI